MRPPRRTLLLRVPGLVIGVVLAMTVSLLSAPAQAALPQSPVPQGILKTADLSQFNPGNIISDAVFFNSGTMTAAQVQSFLESKVTRCEAGYTCLRDKWDTTRSTSADAMCAAYPGGTSERASTIIVKVAQACGINPQVLLVMLEKEQGLVSHVWPSDWRYTIAMGQGCPDTAACDTRYYGFFNQVYGAAWQLKRYANPPGTSNFFNWYAPGKTWNVRWHPNAACGSSPVFIQNQATADLYYYTPYQPNAAALRAGYGLGDGCSAYGNRNFFQYFSDWFGSTQGNWMIGNLEAVQAYPGGFRVTGWAAKKGTTTPTSVHVYVGAAGSAWSADLVRSDVGAAYPALGANHGFDARVAATGSGTVQVCVYVMNPGGAPAVLDCRNVAAMSGSPGGRLDSAQGVEGGIRVSGWALDPDVVDPIAVHLYVDSSGTAVTADASRPDLTPHYPAYGDRHGFAATLTASPGQHRVCAYGINVAAGSHSSLGCQDVVVPGQVDRGAPPTGVLDGVSVSGSTATVSGWTFDTDTPTSPVAVHVYVGSAGVARTADKARADVGAVFPSAGANHGFVEQVSLPTGVSNVCVYALNTGSGGHSLLGCRTVTVSSDRGRPPFGNLESVVPVAGGANVSGWAIDPDTTDPIAVHVYADAVGTAYLADDARGDVAAIYPASGALHGFADFVPMTSGAHRVCVYAINNGAGGHTAIGCRDVVIP